MELIKFVKVRKQIIKQNDLNFFVPIDISRFGAILKTITMLTKKLLII